MDEPTGELDPKSSRQIFQMLKRLNEEHKMTIVIIEQKIMLLCEYARKLAVMKHGELLCYGSVPDVVKQSDKLEEAGINIPRVSTLCRMLKEKGLTQEEMCIHVDETETMIRRDILSGSWKVPKDKSLTAKISLAEEEKKAIAGELTAREPKISEPIRNNFV